jgi:hypothetical protein
VWLFLNSLTAFWLTKRDLPNVFWKQQKPNSALRQSALSGVVTEHRVYVYRPLKDKAHKCRHLKKLTCNGTLRQVFIRLRARTLYPPPLHTVFTKLHVYTVYLFTQGRRGRGESWTREKGRGATVHKAKWKIPTWLTASPILYLNSDRHLSLYR